MAAWPRVQHLNSACSPRPATPAPAVAAMANPAAERVATEPAAQGSPARAETAPTARRALALSPPRSMVVAPETRPSGNRLASQGRRGGSSCLVDHFLDTWPPQGIRAAQETRRICGLSRFRGPLTSQVCPRCDSRHCRSRGSNLGWPPSAPRGHAAARWVGTCSPRPR
jgi:hypothetical protein